MLNDVRERLKNSDFSLFGNIDEILATIPCDLNGHMQAIIKLNNSIDDPVTLLKCLKCPDASISYVNDALIDRYQEELKNRTKTIRLNEFLNREQIQTVIIETNRMFIKY
ncbi:hypothetical protein LOAG_13040 [Loa loa]|uniref:Uncharacterized protein n=1 Tax=Loa loa TaxID=7209 RepID=A0A1S0TKP4_LOALO|nr:hypothetical protein LOAG_13040 [Loa loa]EFO15470.1 hypothetical protein LOAG_13040 [Loa loa]